MKLIIEAVNEELGIAGKVSESVSMILDIIMSEIGNVSYSPMFIGDSYTINKRCSVGTISKNIDLFGRCARLNLIYFKGASINDINAAKLDMGITMNGMTNYNKRNITVCVSILGGKIYDIDKLKETIQHELQHYYEFRNKGYQMDDNTYSMSRTLKKSADAVSNQIGNLLYYCHKSEIQAFANGAYAKCKNSVIPRMEIKQTNLYKSLIIVDDIWKNLNNPIFKNKVEFVLEQNNLTMDKLEKIYSSGRKLIVRNIGRVIIKIESEIENNSYID